VLAHGCHPVIGNDKERGEVALLPYARHKGTQRPIDQPIALEHRGWNGSLRCEIPSTPGNTTKRKRHGSRGIEPRSRDRPVEHRIAPDRSGCCAERGAANVRRLARDGVRG